MSARNIYWIEPDRFDIKPNKSPWLEMSKVLSRNGYDVTIVTGFGKSHYRSGDSSIKIITMPAINLPLIYRMTLLFNIMIWMLIKSKKNGIVIMGPASLVLAPFLLMAGINKLHLDIRTIPVEINNIKSRIDKMIFWHLSMRIMHRLAKSYSFITEPLKEAVLEEFDFRIKDYVIWQSGVNTKLFKPIDRSNQVSKTNNLNILYHGSITRNRGLDRVIEALSQMEDNFKNNITFTIIGDGPDANRLMRLVNYYNLTAQVKFKGYMQYEDMPKQISLADYGIYPLPFRKEWNVSSPIKILEYMACGKPMILTPIPANMDVAKNQDFIVWAHSDTVSDIQHAIELAFANKNIYLHNANKAPAYVRSNYEWEKQGIKLADYLNKKYQ